MMFSIVGHFFFNTALYLQVQDLRDAGNQLVSFAFVFELRPDSAGTLEMRLEGPSRR